MLTLLIKWHSSFVHSSDALLAAELLLQNPACTPGGQNALPWIFSARNSAICGIEATMFSAGVQSMKFCHCMLFVKLSVEIPALRRSSSVFSLKLAEIYCYMEYTVGSVWPWLVHERPKMHHNSSYIGLQRIFTKSVANSQKQWCSPRGQALASRRLEAKFYGLGLGLGLEGQGLGLGLGLESCVDNFWHYPQT